MRTSTGLWLLALLGLASGGCGKEDDHGHSHGGGGTVEVPDHYAHAVEKCQELSKKIDKLIAEGHMDDVHPAAADIKKIAEKLPELARKDLPGDMLRDVTIKARELAGMFSEIDEAADAGRKEDTVAAHNKMKSLIAELKKHAGHAKEGHHDDH